MFNKILYYAKANHDDKIKIDSYTLIMPKKIRELKQILLKAGFHQESGKGSHTKWYHSLLPGAIVLSGKDGNDAKTYQEKDVKSAIDKLEKIRKTQEEN
ncbi:MAG TPA: type II toxin-antitoxin system HicA family toxin [Allocoleopsis sp.]